MSRPIQDREDRHRDQLKGFANILAGLYRMVQIAASETYERRSFLLLCQDQNTENLQLFARTAGQECFLTKKVQERQDTAAFTIRVKLMTNSISCLS